MNGKELIVIGLLYMVLTNQIKEENILFEGDIVKIINGSIVITFEKDNVKIIDGIIIITIGLYEIVIDRITQQYKLGKVIIRNHDNSIVYKFDLSLNIDNNNNNNNFILFTTIEAKHETVLNSRSVTVSQTIEEFIDTDEGKFIVNKLTNSFK